MRKEMTIVSLFLLLPLFCRGADWKNFRADAKRMEERVNELSKFGANLEGGVSRVAFSEADVDGRNYIKGLMEKAGLKVRVDAAGNIIGRREGHDPKLPVILFGSHNDSVPHGGNYDGDVGVLGALECIEVLKQHNHLTNHPPEVAVFSDEEGGLTGSHAVAGELSPEALQLKSHSGKTIGEGIRFIGGDPDHLQSAKRNPSEIRRAEWRRHHAIFCGRRCMGRREGPRLRTARSLNALSVHAQLRAIQVAAVVGSAPRRSAL
jgi:N-carbamoyl-L-amino-acid hydrolase